MPLQRRIFYAIIATFVSFILLLLYWVVAVEPINDLSFPFCGATALLQGLDPYGNACIIAYKGRIYPPNPLTTILAVMPFIPFQQFGPLVLWAIMTGLLVFGLLQDGEIWKLLTLLSAPYWVAFLALQWSPLILAVALLPSLLPLALIKPQTGLPIILTNLTRWRVVACIGFVLLTLIIDVTWPLRWLPQISTYDGYIPALVLPIGLILLLAAVRWREKDARFLLLMSIVPQRGMYDLLSLWSILKTPRQMIILNILSWVAYFLVLLTGITLLPLLSILLIYLPLLAITFNITKETIARYYQQYNRHQA